MAPVHRWPTSATTWQMKMLSGPCMAADLAFWFARDGGSQLPRCGFVLPRKSCSSLIVGLTPAEVRYEQLDRGIQSIAAECRGAPWQNHSAAQRRRTGNRPGAG